MSPIAKKLLSDAYQNYLKTGDFDFTYQSKDSDDLYYAVEAARQLYEENLIDTDLDFIVSRSVTRIPMTSLSFSFAITEKGCQKF